MFATVHDVASLTGSAVPEPTLMQANAIVEMASGRSSDSTSLSAKDTRMLRMATAYQASWMREHPDIFTNMDILSHSQLDVSVTYRNTPESSYLAPLARYAIRRLSNKGSRSVQVDSDFLNDERDIGIPWKPISLAD